MSASVLLSRLDHVRRAGTGRWRARCPVHGGRNPASLSVRELDDGTLLVRCFVRDCSAADIVAAVGLELHDLFPARELAAGEHRRRPERRPWPQPPRAIRPRLTASEWKTLYVGLYCHGLLPARSLVVLFHRHPERVHA